MGYQFMEQTKSRDDCEGIKVNAAYLMHWMVLRTKNCGMTRMKRQLMMYNPSLWKAMKKWTTLMISMWTSRLLKLHNAVHAFMFDLFVCLLFDMF